VEAEPAVESESAVEVEASATQDEEASEPTVMNAEELLGASTTDQPTEAAAAEAGMKALVEAVIYVTEEPLTVEQIANALDQPKERVVAMLQQLTEEYSSADRGITIREVAGGYKMGTKPEHHEAIRNFVKRMKAPLKLSIAALETLAVIAYKQPITAPEIMEIRGVQGAGVIKTLLDRKLIAIGGRKQVVGKPILYKTTKEFLMQFGLKDLAELPTLKEFEELRRLAFADTEDGEAPAPAESPKPASEPETQVEAAAEAPAAESTVQVEQASEQSTSIEPAETAAESTDNTAAASSE
ncbi:MAG: SMC-Scp complex subunit ScpB, partial [Acidobacteria bacterium]|nr:SMC-Scp complex subunit ScpB [Acidobacteriota bacterium]